MKRDDGTLFRPDPKVGAFQPRAAAASGGSSDDDPEVGVADRIKESMRSARRRKLLTAFVLFVGSILTTAGAMLAPKSYESDATILVQRSALTGNGGFAATPDEVRQQSNEYTQQILSNDNIIAIVQRQQLVSRWDEMRPPHRKLLDRLNEQVGRRPSSSDEKLDALVKTLNAKMKVLVDGTTVNISVEWSEPKASRDIIENATKNFIDTRYQAEVGVLPENVRIAESAVKKAKEEFEESFKLYEERLQRNQVRVPAPGGGGWVTPRAPLVADTDGDPTIRTRLEQVRKELNDREGAKRARLEELRQKKQQMATTFAPGHPEMIQLSQLIATTEADNDEIDRLRGQERELTKQYEASKVKAPPPMPAPGPAAPATAAPVVKEVTPKSSEDVLARFESSKQKYALTQGELDESRKSLVKAEAVFKQRYKVTHPAEIPVGPKKPVHVIAFVVGVILTIIAALAAAVLRDRSAGIFYEPRDVRDRLRLPVFANMKRN